MILFLAQHGLDEEELRQHDDERQKIAYFILLFIPRRVWQFEHQSPDMDQCVQNGAIEDQKSNDAIRAPDL